jgi:catechol 2,3-dioxygenase-like lactoylglutathione lyase family enzyme
VRITEDKSITTAIAPDEPKMVVPNVAEAAAWYAKYFGAKVVKQGKNTVAEIPGSNILFVESKGTIAPTKGRALDHLGFEVANLEEFLKKLDGSGAKFDGQIRAAKGIALSISMMTDPWGTYIELSQGLSAVK